MGRPAREVAPSARSRSRTSSYPVLPTRLTLDQIVAAAKEVLQQYGVEGFTFRRLTTRLGVSIAATHYHVASKDALLRLVAVDMNSAIELPGPEFGDWVERCRIIVLRLREEWVRYPGMTRYNIEHLDEDPSKLTDFVLEMLRDAGFTEESALRASTTLFYYTMGAALADGVVANAPLTRAQRGTAEERFAAGLDTILLGLRLELDGHGPRRHQGRK